MTGPAPAGYRILLCHRRKADLDRAEFQERYRAEVVDKSASLKPALGYVRCERLFQYEHPSLLHGLLANSRSGAAISLFSVLSGKEPPRLTGALLSREADEFDLVEQFAWESEAHVRSTLGAGGQAAAAELAARASRLVERTQVIAGPQYQLLPRTVVSPSTKLMFCLRRRPCDSTSEMQRYWLHDHGRLVVGLQPALKTSGYEQVHASLDPEIQELAGRFRVGKDELFEGAACLWYESAQKLAATLAEPACLRANLELQKDELKFVDGQRCQLVFGEERGADQLH
jgi:hypothetical protein